MLICAESRTQEGGQTDDRHTDHSQQEAAGVRRELERAVDTGLVVSDAERMGLDQPVISAGMFNPETSACSNSRKDDVPSPGKTSRKGSRETNSRSKKGKEFQIAETAIIRRTKYERNFEKR